ncbi:MAG: acyl-CoA dehydrogenase family protein [Pseudomonadales bacterium]|nr:acyl-CoA dehydrogenase family protein [Pseudomonadales bacterium]
MNDLDNFRKDVAVWLEDNCPASMRTPMKETDTIWGGRKFVYPSDDAKCWKERMAAKGWTAPTWPKEYGGGGLTEMQAAVLKQEMRRLGCRVPLMSFGLGMLGPALLEFGNEVQKQTHIPKIVNGDIRWCQGYSEPGAGSDLASLQTSAVDKGDHFLVNGHKIWTSYANHADWIFCLVRTDKTKKHDGISFLLFDMESEGVSTRPIQLISGSSPFCETFFENVKVPKENLVGPLNGGWTIAKRLLQHERAMISEIGFSDVSAQSAPLADVAKEMIGEEQGQITDHAIREKIALHEIKTQAFLSTLKRSAAEAKAGQSVGATSSMFKYYGTENNKSKFELLMTISGHQSLGWEGDGFSEQDLATARKWLRSKGNSIEGGTSEVQLNVIAKRVLGLPD